MAPLCYGAKVDPFLSFPKERKGSNFAIWQPYPQLLDRGQRPLRLPQVADVPRPGAQHHRGVSAADNALPERDREGVRGVEQGGNIILT